MLKILSRYTTVLKMNKFIKRLSKIVLIIVFALVLIASIVLGILQSLNIIQNLWSININNNVELKVGWTKIYLS